MCNNRVEYTIPKGYSYATLDYKCGSTGTDGEAVLCRECERKIRAGEMSRPGYCRHGTPLMDPTDHYDITCSACEGE